MKIGDWGETKGADFLKNKGYFIVERNYRRKTGEIDIIAYDGKILCFIEVKTRRSLNFGFPCEAINRQKIRHIIRTAQYYLLENNMTDQDFRIDSVEILRGEDDYYVRHMENIVMF